MTRSRATTNAGRLSGTLSADVEPALPIKKKETSAHYDCQNLLNFSMNFMNENGMVFKFP